MTILFFAKTIRLSSNAIAMQSGLFITAHCVCVTAFSANLSRKRAERLGLNISLSLLLKITHRIKG